MNYYYITGTTRGIGKALAEHLLEDPSNYVIGISRRKGIEHPNYKHSYLDLADIDALANFKFELHVNVKRVYLINNAGVIGIIKPVGKLDASSIIKEYTVNLIAPTVLTNAFIKCYDSTDAEKVILNVSSIAGRKPTDCWAVYCASKAGINMLSQVVDAEQKMRTTKSLESIHKGFHIFSICPGLTNSGMQEEIRAADGEDFSRLEELIGYKMNNQLSEPEFVAKKYIRILANINNIKDVLSSLKDYE